MVTSVRVCVCGVCVTTEIWYLLLSDDLTKHLSHSVLKRPDFILLRLLTPTCKQLRIRPEQNAQLVQRKSIDGGGLPRPPLNNLYDKERLHMATSPHSISIGW